MGNIKSLRSKRTSADRLAIVNRAGELKMLYPYLGWYAIAERLKVSYDLLMKWKLQKQNCKTVNKDKEAVL